MAGHVHGSDAWLSDVLHPILQFQSLAGSPQSRRQTEGCWGRLVFWIRRRCVNGGAPDVVERQGRKDARTRGAGAVEEWWPSKGKSRRTSSARKRAGHSSHHSTGKLSAIRHRQSLSALCPPLPSALLCPLPSSALSPLVDMAEHQLFTNCIQR